MAPAARGLAGVRAHECASGAWCAEGISILQHKTVGPVKGLTERSRGSEGTRSQRLLWQAQGHSLGWQCSV